MTHTSAVGHPLQQAVSFLFLSFHCISSVLSLLWILIFCDFKKKNKFAHAIVSKKKNFCMITSCSPVFPELFLFHFLFFYCFELLCRNLLLLFLFIFCSFFRVSLFFLSFLSFVLPFCCLHTFCEHRFFSESSSFKCVSFLSFFDSLF